MRSKDKNFFIRSIVIFSFALWIISLVGIGFWEFFGSEESKWWIVFVLLFISVFVGYTITSYILSPLFKTNKLLDILLKDTLHELNIPLCVIKANLQMLQSGEVDTKKNERLGRIALASDDLHSLYKEVDYYIKREIQEDVKEVFHLHTLIAQVVEKLQSVGELPKIIQNVSHVELFADKHGFAKVITNVLSNAIKYNQNNNDIEVYQEENKLIIKDNGIGMSESELFLVFDRYYQTDSSKEGQGIGLSIVKAYCDDCKIFININSKKNEGTKVVLDISNLFYKR